MTNLGSLLGQAAAEHRTASRSGWTILSLTYYRLRERPGGWPHCWPTAACSPATGSA